MSANTITTAAARPVDEPECPRCGYDLTGLAASWSTACPVDGVCSECGLEFPWRNILNPTLTIPKWSFEHARRRLVRRFFGTLARAFLPRRFYGRLTMFAPVRVGRLVAIVVMWAVVMHVVISLTAATKTYLVTPTAWPTSTVWPATGLPAPWDQAIKAAVVPYRNSGYIRAYLFEPWMALPMLWAALVPLPFLVLVHTLKIARVQRRHLLRGWAYSLAPIMAIVTLGIVVRPTIMTLAQAWRWEWTWAWNGPWFAAPWYCVAGGVHLIWHWRVFTSTYLRLPQPRLVTTLMLVTSFLAALSLALAFVPGFANGFAYVFLI